MAREIEGPDGVVIEFPDDTSEDKIKEVLAKRYPADNSSRQWGKVLSGALAPYATAAAAGGAAGAPFGGVGAGPGAAGGVLSLGLADLGTYGVNALSGLFGGPQFQQPSDTIRQKYIDVGLAAEPQTASQRVASDVVGATSGGAAQALGFGLLQNAPRSQTMRNIMAMMAEAPGAQTAASAGGAAAPSVAANYMGVKDPTALAALGFGGGMAAGMKASPKIKPVDPQSIIDRGTAAYQGIEAQGVKLTSPALRVLARDAETALSKAGYVPQAEGAVKSWVNILKDVGRQPLDFSKLDALHSSIMGEAAATKNANTQRLLYKLADQVDDFMGNVQPGHTTAGNVGTVSTDLTAARRDYRQGKRSQAIAGVFERADNAVAASKTSTEKKGLLLGEALHQQFSALMKNKREFARFNPDEQAAIKDVVAGNNVRHALAKIGGMAPSNLRYASVEMGVPTGLAVLFGAHPGAGAAVGGLAMGIGTAAKRQANKATIRSAETAQRYIGGSERPPNTMPIILGISSRAAIEADAKARRDQSQSRR